MIFCREQIIFFEKAQPQQIFPDACDFGILITEDNKDIIRHHLMELNEWADVERLYTTDQQWKRVYSIPVEHEANGWVSGYQITVSYANLKGKQWLDFYINRTEWFPK